MLGLFTFEGGTAGLAGVGAFAGFLEAIGLAFDLHDLGVVREPVEESDDGCGTLEDLVPLRKRLVGGDDRGDALISAGDDLEEQVSGSRVVAEITDFVDAEQLRTRVVTEPLLKGVSRLALGQIGKQSARDGKQSRNAV